MTQTKNASRKLAKLFYVAPEKVFFFKLKDIMSITIRYYLGPPQIMSKTNNDLSNLVLFCKCLRKIFHNLTVVVFKLHEFRLIIHDKQNLLCFVLHFDIYCIACFTALFPISVVTSTEIKQKKVQDKDKFHLFKRNHSR